MSTTRGNKPSRAESGSPRLGEEAEAPAAGPAEAPNPPRPRPRRKSRLTDPDPGPDLDDVEGFGEPTAPITAAPAPGTARARIEYVSPDGKENIRDLVGTTSVGRHTDNHVQLLDPEVSKHHLVIEEVGGLFVLKDLGSANGTLVNGEVRGTAGLEDGDIIEVGNTRLRFCLLQKPVVQPTLTDPPSDPSEFFDSTGPLTGPMQVDPFVQMLSDRHTRSSEPERTTVTLVPGFGPDPETNVFALPMKEDFAKAEAILDEKQIRRDYERLRVAFDLSLEVGLQTNLGALGDTILKRIKGVLPADTAVIMLRDGTGELVPLASSVEGHHADGEVRIPRAIVEQVMSSKEGLLTSDAQADVALRASHTVVGQQIRSALCVPLLVRDEVFGVIHLSSSSAAGAYEERDLSLLRAIAQPAALAVANARLVQRIEEDAKTRAQLSRFLSPALVERVVVEKNLSLDTSGDKVLCSVLFSDIRGFTTLSEGANPETVVRMLNEYFEAMVDVVFDFGGVLDKFIGDGLMAVWGTPVQSPDDATRAIQAAERMRDILDKVVNKERALRGEAPLAAGYGIASGRVIAGAMGASRRLDFTVIGDTVNLASRLCGQAAPGQILACEDSERLAQGLRLRALDARMVKGVSRPVPVFELPRA